ncbi:hypothetical protein MJM04_27735, partial [Salmonella enterica subsp. enterica serovar Cerro]|nr:hypothetical protein [Salmonella enterica subsp. enterica serovar Cerro]
MSNFNTRKDRDRNGNPLPHYRINYLSSEGISYIHYRDSHTGCKIVTNSNEGGTPVNKSMLAGIGIGVAAALGVAAVASL